MMLTLRLYPLEFAGMISFLHQFTTSRQNLPLKRQLVKTLVMAQYLAKWNAQRLGVWQQRRSGKAYSLSLPLPVALALYIEMQETYLGTWQQEFFSKLDHAIISYQTHHVTLIPYQIQAY